MSRKYQKIVIFIDTEDNKNVKKKIGTPFHMGLLSVTQI